MITNVYIAICAVIFLYINFIAKEDKTEAAIRLGAVYPPRIRRNHARFILLGLSGEGSVLNPGQLD